MLLDRLKKARETKNGRTGLVRIESNEERHQGVQNSIRNQREKEVINGAEH